MSGFKLKVISDGTSKGTKVVRADTGEMLLGVRSVSWMLGVGGRSVARLEIIGVEIEADIEMVEIHASDAPDDSRG